MVKKETGRKVEAWMHGREAHGMEAWRELDADGMEAFGKIGCRWHGCRDRIGHAWIGLDMHGLGMNEFPKMIGIYMNFDGA